MPCTPSSTNRAGRSCDKRGPGGASALRGSLLGRVRPGDVTVDRGSADAMLRTAAACLAARIEAGDDRALGVEDLGLPVDPQAAIGIQHPNARDGRVDRRPVDAMPARLPEFFLHPFLPNPV